MSSALREELALLPNHLASHLFLSACALAAGVAISLALAFLAMRFRALQAPLLAIASTIQTVPALALLALMVPLLGRIGVVPALAALVLYSVLPILRNAITGLNEVDPSLVQAGVGLGMTPTQILWKVRVPLALPVIVAGIRTATIWVVGMATLSTPVGATSLGNFIFAGLQTQNYTAVLVGCVSVAALALTLDLLVRWLEVAARDRSVRSAVAAGAVTLVLLGAGLAPRFAHRGDTRATVRLGGKTFTEQYVLMELLAGRVEAAGLRAEKLESLGSAVVFNALVQGEIDVYVDYTGTIWANHMQRTDHPGAERVLAETSAWLRDRHGVLCLGALGFENAYALAVRRAMAEELSLASLADLAPHAHELAIGGDYEFFRRPEWSSVRDAYGLAFREERTFDPSLMYRAVADRDVDVISAFSTDGRIAGYDLVVLEDPREALPPYDAVLLLSEAAARRPALVAVLEPLVGAIDDDAMRRANKWVDVDGESVGTAARRLADGLGGGDGR